MSRSHKRTATWWKKQEKLYVYYADLFVLELCRRKIGSMHRSMSQPTDANQAIRNRRYNKLKHGSIFYRRIKGANYEFPAKT